MTLEEEKSALANIENDVKNTLTEIGRLESELKRFHFRYSRRVGIYKQMRTTLQRKIWALEGKRLCRECKKLQNIGSFKYLYLSLLSKRSGYETGYDAVRELVCICVECFEKILSPEYSAYSVRMLAEKQNDKFFVFHEGKFRPLEKVFDDVSSIQIEEDVDVIPESLFTVGCSF